MADSSPILALPYLAPAQAQKHVTHNEALQRLDIVVQLHIREFDAVQPPALPVEGDVYATGTGARDAWAGQDDMIAAFTDGAWLFLEPRDGWVATQAGSGAQRVRQAGAWGPVPIPDPETLGINTPADTTNRLAVRADASLFIAQSGSHRIKVNKDTPGDTATLLFQSGFSGRAEMGLAGSDAWSLKVSDTGDTWTEAVVVSAVSGNIGMGTRDPQYPLHIHRPLGTGASILLSNETTGSGPTDGFWFGYSNKAYFWNYEATDTQFATSNATRMTITAAGLVGIGTTTPTCALEVRGPVRPGSYAATDRPDAAAAGAGACIYDTTLSKPLWSDGTAWRDATGATV